jgi:hypothetical protein
MDASDKDQVLHWYELLEHELLDLFRYIPPIGDNLKTCSPRIATIVVECCGLLDSAFRQASPDPAHFNGRTKRRRRLQLPDYAKLHTATLGLHTAKSILLTTPPRYISPFYAWTDLVAHGKFRTPSWWTTHNRLKHDRIANLRKARLEVAIESLCGLHLVLAILPDFAKTVLARGWVPGGKPSPEITIEVLEGTGSGSLLVESKLFAVARGRETFPEKIEDFHPSLFNASERIIDIFGRWY